MDGAPEAVRERLLRIGDVRVDSLAAAAVPRRLGGGRRFAEHVVLMAILFAALVFGARHFAPEPRSPAESERLRRLVLGSLGGVPQPTAHLLDTSLLPVTAVIGRGEDVAAALLRAGIGEAQAQAVQDALAAKLSRVPGEAGTSLELVLEPGEAPGRPRRLVSLQMQAGMDSRLSVEHRADRFHVTVAPIPVDATPLRIEGAVGANFTRSALLAGAPSTAIQQYLQALDAHSSEATNLRPDDRFDMVVEYKRSASGERQSGDVMMARLERDGSPVVELLRDRSGAFVPYSDLDPAVRSAGGLLQPVSGRVTSRFGMRFHPILGYERMHSGVDLAAPWGTPIRAVRNGAVSFAGWSGGHGEYVTIRHPGGLVSGYGHISRIAVSPGTPVQAGDIIGYVGATGLASGPHLHFELFRGGRAIDPMTVEQLPPAGPEQHRERDGLHSRLAWFKRLIPGAALRAAQPARPSTGS